MRMMANKREKIEGRGKEGGVIQKEGREKVVELRQKREMILRG